MSRSATHLQLVPAAPLADTPATVSDGEQLTLFSDKSPFPFLGLIDVSRLSDTQFIELLQRHRPRYIFDARLAPYLNIGRLYRRDVFELFASLGTIYLCTAIHAGETSDPGAQVAQLLLQDWFATPRPNGVALIFLQEATTARELRHSIRQHLASKARKLPSIQVLNLD